jgi:hypothetical protein
MALRLLGGVLRRHDRGEAAGDLSDPWDHDDVYWDAENDRVARESKAMTWATVESSAVGCQSAASEALSSEGGQDPPPQPPHRPHCALVNKVGGNYRRPSPRTPPRGIPGNTAKTADPVWRVYLLSASIRASRRWIETNWVLGSRW